MEYLSIIPMDCRTYVYIKGRKGGGERETCLICL